MIENTEKFNGFEARKYYLVFLAIIATINVDEIAIQNFLSGEKDLAEIFNYIIDSSLCEELSVKAQSTHDDLISKSNCYIIQNLLNGGILGE